MWRAPGSPCQLRPAAQAHCTGRILGRATHRGGLSKTRVQLPHCHPGPVSAVSPDDFLPEPSASVPLVLSAPQTADSRGHRP